MLKKMIFILCICVGTVLVSSCDSGRAVMVVDSGTDLYTDRDGLNDSDTCASDNMEVDAVSHDSNEQAAVYVCGAVVNPGVYYMPHDALKQEALMSAGGFADGAAIDYVNLAERVCDGEKLYFPYEEELENSVNLISEESDDGRVNINTADAAELMTLPGIGERKANAIISYREENGAFSSIEEVMNITGIKEGVYNNIKDFIVVK